MQYVFNHTGILLCCILKCVQTSPVFSYLLGMEIIQLLTPNKSEISPGPLEGANLYSFLFGKLFLQKIVNC